MKIVTPEQMRLIETRSENVGVFTDTLMENAGLAVAEWVRRRLGSVDGVSVVVLVGPGNNGGDGLVTARHLHDWGALAGVYLCSDRRPDDLNLERVAERSAGIVRASADGGLADLRDLLGGASLVVDAVVGTARSRPLSGVIRDALLELAAERARRPGIRIVALDVPSGLDADTGAADPATPVADDTVTLGYPKMGLYAFPGAEFAGLVEIVDIGVPSGLDYDVRLELMTDRWARAVLPPRPPSSHKGTFGSAMIVAGSASYIGAAYLAASAAGRSGAGLVTLAMPRSLVPAVAAAAHEPTYLPLPESSPGIPAPESAELVLDHIDGYDSLLVGCGLGQSPEAARLVDRLLLSGAALPRTVVDADGLNLLSRHESPRWWERMPQPAIVTPHPGEMARLAGVSTGAIQEDRAGVAREMARKWGKVVVLKGAFTVAAFPTGDAMLSPLTNPGLATAGTGDVLAGTIAGLLAQGLSPETAAPLGVYLHGKAAEAVREEMGDAGMIAGDLLPALPRAIKALKQSAGTEG